MASTRVPPLASRLVRLREPLVPQCPMAGHLQGSAPTFQQRRWTPQAHPSTRGTPRTACHLCRRSICSAAATGPPPGIRAASSARLPCEPSGAATERRAPAADPAGAGRGVARARPAGPRDGRRRDRLRDRWRRNGPRDGRPCVGRRRRDHAVAGRDAHPRPTTAPARSTASGGRPGRHRRARRRPGVGTDPAAGPRPRGRPDHGRRLRPVVPRWSLAQGRPDRGLDRLVDRGHHRRGDAGQPGSAVRVGDGPAHRRHGGRGRPRGARAVPPPTAPGAGGGPGDGRGRSAARQRDPLPDRGRGRPRRDLQGRRRGPLEPPQPCLARTHRLSRLRDPGPSGVGLHPSR